MANQEITKKIVRRVKKANDLKNGQETISKMAIITS